MALLPRRIALGLVCSLALSLVPISPALANINKQDALNKALRFVQVERKELEELKIQNEREGNIPVYKVEFATAYGDFDFAYAISDGRLIDADYEIDEEYLRRLPRHNFDVKRAVNFISSKLHIPARTIEARREGNRIEARAYYQHMVYEIELDCRSGVMYDFNADRRQ